MIFGLLIAGVLAALIVGLLVSTFIDDTQKQIQALRRQLADAKDEILAAIKKNRTEETVDLTQILAKVTAQTTVIEGAKTLLGQLSDLIKNNANNPTALQQIADAIDANTTELSGAIVANTPAASN